jgi:hypothetical protein
MANYSEFIKAKSQLDAGAGFAPLFMPDYLFDFQNYLSDFSIRMGRSAVYADCGMGKTVVYLVWSENVVRKTNRPVIIAAPLAVSFQIIEEAEKFGIEAVRCMDGRFKPGARIVVTNYERLHYFNPHDFAGMVCDESSILKNFDGARKAIINEFMRLIEFRLLCTATPSPNDYIELGTSSEALGYLGYMDMLSTFFKNDEDSLHPAFIGSKWRFKRHAEQRFWRWMASWSRACRKPSDLGFDDRTMILPELIVREHAVLSPAPEGYLFEVPAQTLEDQRKDMKKTLPARCEKAAELLSGDDCGIAWCHLNEEGDLLEKLIPGAVQVSGADSDDRKEEVFSAFRHGKIAKLVTKSKIAAFGMNWQHCHRMTYFPTHSWEQYYQSVRRCWRFGQKHDVIVDAITTTGQTNVIGNWKRKAVACDEMFGQLVLHMSKAIKLDRMTEFKGEAKLPSWL